jgi:hypothetical protein
MSSYWSQIVQKQNFNAWFATWIYKVFTNNCIMQYDELIEENDGFKPLLEMAKTTQLWWIPLILNIKSWLMNDVVEVYHSNLLVGWHD